MYANGLCKFCRFFAQVPATRQWRGAVENAYRSGKLLPAPPPPPPPPSLVSVRSVRTGLVIRATEGERKMEELLRKNLEPSYLSVRDISGGCGSAYEITIDSELFSGKRLLQQHRMVNEALGEEIEAIHALTIRIGNPDKPT